MFRILKMSSKHPHSARQWLGLLSTVVFIVGIIGVVLYRAHVEEEVRLATIMGQADRLYYGDGGTDIDIAQAADLYKEACDSREPRGCLEYAYHLSSGHGIEKSESAAASIVTDAMMREVAADCDVGDGRACSRIGTIYESGIGVTKDEKAAVQYFQKACELDDGIGCYNLGLSYQNGIGVASDKSKVVEYYRKGCDLDDGISCTNLGPSYRFLGGMYANGDGVVKDVKEAAKYYKKGCELDDGISCTNLGLSYQNGIGVSLYKSEAVEYFQKACDLKDAEGCIRVIHIYKTVSRTPTLDASKAVEYFQKACELEFLTVEQCWQALRLEFSENIFETINAENKKPNKITSLWKGEDFWLTGSYVEEIFSYKYDDFEKRIFKFESGSFGIDSITVHSEKLTFLFGIKVGVSKQKILKTFGPPDRQTSDPKFPEMKELYFEYEGEGGWCNGAILFTVSEKELIQRFEVQECWS
jgi:TPR repeat protein